MSTEPRPSRTISQRTIAVMIDVYDYLFFRSSAYVAAGPRADIDKFRGLLYAMNVSREFLDKCEYRYRWKFDSLLPALNDGSFFADDRRYYGAQAKEHGQAMLHGFATALCGILTQYPEHETQNTRYFRKSLLEDGFQYVGTKLLETNQDIIEEAQEISAVESLIRASIHDNQKTLLHHFHNGRNLFDAGTYHPSVGEWRSFLEETLRGVWRLTRAHRPEFATHSEKPGMKDLLEFLQRAGFLNADEQLAFSSTWGFLCAGGHPGIGERDDAHLSMTLALTFGHAALLKLQKWGQGSFSHF